MKKARLSILERLDMARKNKPTRKKCPVDHRPPDDVMPLSVPPRLRNSIVLLYELRAYAAWLLQETPSNDGGIWFVANCEAIAVESIIMDALRKCGGYSSRYNLTLCSEWRFHATIR